MSTIYWTGKADAIAQVVQVTAGGAIGTETFTLTTGGVSVTYDAEAGDTATDVAQGLRDAWNDASHPYMSAVTATEDGGVLVLTADVPGVPFSVTASATGSATLNGSTTVASAGPNDWSTAQNWSTGSVPANGDRVVITNNADSIMWGLDQDAVTLESLTVEQSFTGVLGLAESTFALSADDADDTKREYRGTYLRIGVSTVRIGDHHGKDAPAGSSRIKLDTLTTPTQLNVVNTADNSADLHMEPVRWVGNHEDNVVNITKGKLAIAANAPGETATIAELNVGRSSNAAGSVTVHIGDGVAIETINQAAGSISLGSDVDTLNQAGGRVITYGDAAITTANVGGSAQFNASGVITNLRVRGGGVADFSLDPRTRTVTNCYLHRGAALNLSNGNPLSVTLTNDIEFVQCEPADTILTIGPDVRVAISSI